jgi:hypothetical protein
MPAMVTRRDGKSVLKGWLVEFGRTVGRLLDPHLRSGSEVERASGADRWPLRKTLLYLIGISLLIWAATIVVIRFLFGR